MFKDREEAGRKLGRALEAYRDSDVLVLAIPRGGVEVGYYVAESMRIQAEQKQEIDRRIEILRQGEPLPEIGGRTVILVDDGIAMGSTMQAAVMLCRNEKAKKVVAAAPVAGPPAASDLANVVDEIAILEEPMFFHAVAQAYENWYDVPDAEVVKIMQKSKRSQLQSH